MNVIYGYYFFIYGQNVQQSRADEVVMDMQYTVNVINKIWA